MSSLADGAPFARRGPAPDEDPIEAFLEGVFDDATQLAMQVCRAPLAAVSVQRKDHHWFKSRGGISVAETPRAIALCAEAAATRELMVLADVAADRRFRDDPLVRGSIRFFAGIPLVHADGTVLGTLAVMDREPRPLAPEQAEALRALGREVQKELRLRVEEQELHRAIWTLENEAKLAHAVHQLHSETIACAGQ
ncbi:MAG TPA: GAF domain-containing protein, partial [Thermoanaerobaculia bacterium]|nr:GAF domain-containing protein [Thermoanaerobaculia bacterium]